MISYLKQDAARLSEIFGEMREDKTDLSGVLDCEPQLTVPPQLSKDGLLRVGRFFPSPTSQINYELIFAPVMGRWKIAGVMANVGPSGPVAPMPAPLPQQPQANGSNKALAQ